MIDFQGNSQQAMNKLIFRGNVFFILYSFARMTYTRYRSAPTMVARDPVRLRLYII